MSTAEPAKQPRASHRCAAAILSAVVLAAGIVLRVLGAWWYRNDTNPDYAVVVEMVRHMAAGIDWPVFFYGQAYMGSLEPTASVLFAWAGIPTPFAVCLGTAFFGVLLLVAIRRWAADAAGPWAGALAMAAAVVGPPAYFQYMASPRGGYALGLLLIVVILREGCRIAAAESGAGPDNGIRMPAWRYARLGLLGGLAFWNFWLVLPALATAGLLLVASLRLRLFRRRVIWPGLGGFALGSLPFWVYNAMHHWASFAPTNSGSPGLRQVPAIAKLLLTTRLPALLDTGRGLLWNRLFVLGLVVLAATGIALLAAARKGRRDRPADWMLPAMGIFSCLFLFAYLFSSFGMMNTPRYLLVFIPPLAVLGGIAPAKLFASARRLRSGGRTALIAAAGAVVLAVLIVTVPLACHAASIPCHLRKSAKNLLWRQRTEQLVTALRHHGVKVAAVNYKHWSANWVGDEDPVFCCPQLERYRPFAEALERDENPAVVEDFRGFSDFIAATGAEVTRLPGAGCRVMVDAHAPRQPATVLPHSAISEILENGTTRIGGILGDSFGSTAATLTVSPGTDCTIDIETTAPMELCGIRLWVDRRYTFDLVAVEKQAPDGAWIPLTRPSSDTGFTWYGPVFYWGGPQHHVDLRFAPFETSRLRLRFSTRRPELHILLKELQLLAPAPPPPPVDFEAVARDLVRSGAERVYANRWLAARLRPLLPEDVWLSPLPRRDVPGDAAVSALLRPGNGVAVLSPPETVEPIRQGIAMMKAPFDERIVGGLTVFDFGHTASERLSAYRGAYFLGGAVHHVDPRMLAVVRGDPPIPEPPMLATYENGDFGIKDVRISADTVRSGDVLDVEIEWHSVGGMVTPLYSTFLCLHFLQDGKIVFQHDMPFFLETADPAPDGHLRYVSRLSVTVPDGVAGEVVPAFCLYRPGIWSRRLKPDTERETSKSRLLLSPIEVTPQPPSPLAP